MNRIYRIIRSRSFNRAVVVSEITKARGKSTVESASTGAAAALSRKLLAGLVAGSFASVPLLAAGSTITNLNGVSLIEAGQKVHNLHAQDMVNSELTGRVGINKFDQFKLSAGEIANLHFNQKNSDIHADSLVNLVNQRIDIAGTVNAIRANRVDGHLFFLSPEGMAVSASGVINAGKLTAIVPTSDLFEKLRDGSHQTFIDNYALYVMSGKNLDSTTHLDEIYSQDAAKSIEIEGTVNTRSGIVLRAAKIDIKAGAKLLANRQIDFASVVNISGDQAVNAGLTGVGMTLKQDDRSGDIILAADVEAYADDVIIPDTFSPANKVTTRQATITVNGSITGDAGVSITSSATSTFNQGSKLNTMELLGVEDNFLSGLGLGLMTDYASKTNTSSITLGASGSITSGADTRIAAVNKVNVKVKSNTPKKKTGEIAGNALPVVSAGVAYALNTATVSIKGDIDSGGDLEVSASSSTKLKVSVKAGTEPDDDHSANHLYFGVGVLAHTTAASITVAEKTNGIFKSKGDIKISASAQSDDEVGVAVEAPDTVTAATTVAVANTDTDASVRIARGLTAGSDLSVSAETTIGKTVTAENGLGEEQFTEEFKLNATKGDGVIDSWSKPLSNWILGVVSGGRFGSNAGGAAAGAAAGAGGAGAGNFVDTLLTNLGSYLRMGSSVAVNAANNTSSVTIYPGGQSRD